VVFDILPAASGEDFNEHVNVVGHDVQSVNLCLNFFRFLVQQLSPSLLKHVYKVYSLNYHLVWCPKYPKRIPPPSKAGGPLGLKTYGLSVTPGCRVLR